MAPPVTLDIATRRFLAAIDQIEAAVERLGRAGTEKKDLEETLALLEDDRERLAEDLDAALGATRRLEEANDDVSARLDGASLALRRIVAAHVGLHDIGAMEPDGP